MQKALPSVVAIFVLTIGLAAQNGYVGAGTTLDAHDMTIDGMNMTPAYLACMVYTDGASGTVRYVEMRNAGSDPANGAQGHIGFIGIGKSTSSPSTIHLKNCLVHRWTKAGVVLGGDGLTGSITDSVVAGSGRHPQRARLLRLRVVAVASAGPLEFSLHHPGRADVLHVVGDQWS